jgi:DNA-binding PadR family transcriptional regulator
MFGRHFERRWRDADWDEEDAPAWGHEHRRHGGEFHRRPFGPRWGRPRFGRFAEREFWFAPHGGRGRFGPPHRRGGPFGDDSFGEGGGRQRHRRGDIKYVLLELLAEQPRHGYELIKELEQRYAGFYRPSPGTVYPTLQLLEDEGHLVSELADGKRVYSVTDAGRQLLKEHQQHAGEREGFGPRGFRGGHADPELAKLREVSMALAASVMQVARHGTPEQRRKVLSLLDATRREIYGILAAGDEGAGEQ